MQAFTGVRAVLFDVDGTLLDTREYIFRAAEHTLGAFKLPVPPRTEIARAVGTPLDGFYRMLAGEKEVDVSALMKEHHEFQKRNLALSVPFPGVAETLAALSERGMVLGGVTNRRSGTAVPTLAAADLMRFMATVVCADEVPNPKPHPDHIHATLSRMSVSAENAVMVGDSSVDVAAGKNAGTKTVRATYGFHTDELHEPEPDAFIADIRELLALLA
ncbi:MAG: HAD-IA family hydrolase [Patescibacteria group bacterium]